MGQLRKHVDTVAYYGIIIQVVVPLVSLFELLQLIHSGADSAAVEGGIGVDLFLCIMRRCCLRYRFLSDGVVRLSSRERFPDIERHHAVGSVTNATLSVLEDGSARERQLNARRPRMVYKVQTNGDELLST